MHRIDTPTAQVDKFGAGKNGFTRGNPQTGVPATALDDDYFDAIQEEIVGVVESSGLALDKSNRTQLLTALKKLFLRTNNNFSEIAAVGSAAVTAALANLGLSDVVHLPQLTGVIGTSRNAKMSVTAASSTATFTADELIVQTALGGLQYKLSRFSKTINLATTGAGGMDTGAVPATGFVALYAIYNPITQASALLAVNATSAVQPEVYGGANMPSGYTASALISAWRTSSSQFVVGFQIDRAISILQTNILTTTTSTSTITSLSIISVVPLNAKSVTVIFSINSGGASGNLVSSLFATSGRLGRCVANGTSTNQVSTLSASIYTPGTTYYEWGSSVAGGSASLDVVGYTF
ncbi:hypothetical protein [Yersinia enterocolitica]|uniref:hypothetical protein n=1 Tax=Yersinia enterocolitica TaxID=630 RepID=UPI0009758454|nr:hypothetical protein [Yersinia enterocolitica]